MSRSWRTATLVLAVLLVILAVGLTPDGVRWIRTEVPLANFGLGWLEMKSVGINATHVALFFAVGLVMACALLPGAALWRAGLACLGLLVLIAVASEALQLGSPGRTPRLVDIRDDLVGGGAVLVLGLCLRAGWRRWRAK